MLTRPSFLRRRRVTSPHFEDTCQLIRGTGAANSYGEWEETEMPGRTIRCAVAPIAGPREAEVREAGLRLSDTRVFWTLESLLPQAATTSGDVLFWSDQRWTVRETKRWAEDLHESMAVRQETQPVVR